MDSPEIKNTLDEIENSLSGLNSEKVGDAKDSSWTLYIKKTVGEIGLRKGYSVCTSGLPKPYEPEWLYDMVWYRNNDATRLLEVPLILESEWNRDPYQIRFDFEKLLIANVPIKVFIYQCYGEDYERIHEGLIAGLNEYTNQTPSTYLLACFRWDKNAIIVERVSQH